MREKLIEAWAEGVRHAKAVTFQMTEVAVRRAVFAAILGRIGRLRAVPGPGVIVRRWLKWLASSRGGRG